MQVLRAHMAGLGIKAGEEARSGTNARRPTAANMSADEAHDVLGVGAGASREDIQAAHRALMKRYHPDQGGSTYLASKINEAKDVLLRQG
jgi:DnaJ-domain-containing protein 1